MTREELLACDAIEQSRRAGVFVNASAALCSQTTDAS